MLRSRVVIALAVPAVALVGYGAVHLVTHESSEPASIAAALARFRALPASARTLPPRLRGRAPQPGVYVYATRGFEVSHVLGTRRHPYPRHTTITVSVTPRGCLRTRWDLLATRHDATLACPRLGAAARLIDQSEEHEFADHVDRRAYLCTRRSTAGPPRLLRGARWHSRCAIDGTTTVDDGVAIGPRTLTLDGARTRTVLLRTTTRVSGETTGVGTSFTWVLPDTRLVVRRTIANASTTSTIVGDVRYEERATLALTSARPRR
ncbi:MAG TPA: hypothetical protein VFS37_01985 [Conexibacter sp.]|nr:hypothetical protein [Conexibacter sp.]